MVIFGASGDLTKRKLMPALYRLAADRRLSTGFSVIGISRSPFSSRTITPPSGLGADSCFQPTPDTRLTASMACSGVDVVPCSISTYPLYLAIRSVLNMLA